MQHSDITAILFHSATLFLLENVMDPSQSMYKLHCDLISVKQHRYIELLKVKMLKSLGEYLGFCSTSHANIQVKKKKKYMDTCS